MTLSCLVSFCSVFEMIDMGSGCVCLGTELGILYVTDSLGSLEYVETIRDT